MKKKSILIISGILIFSVLGFAQDESGGNIGKSLISTNAEVVKLTNEGKYDEALSLAREAVSIAESKYGKKHLETAKTLENLGYVLQKKGELEDAADALKDSFKVFENQPNLSKEDGYAVAKMLEIIGSAESRKNVLSSKKYFESALEWHNKYGDANSYEVIAILTTIAKIDYWQRDFKNSAELYKQAVEKAASIPDFDKDKFSIIMESGACSYRKAGKFDEFEKFQEKYIPKKEKTDKKITKEDLEDLKETDKRVVNGSAISLPKPAYPQEAKIRKARGKVNVQIMIDGTGKVVTACAVNKKELSMMLVSELAAYRARFNPTLLDGKSVLVTGIIVYNFVPY